MGEKGNANAYDHDTKSLATIFAETGFDVDISPLRQTPQATARMAIESDVHVICLLSNANSHKILIADLVKMLAAEHADNIKIVIGGIIPRSDYKILYDAGVDMILKSVSADPATLNQLIDLFE